MDSPFTPSSPAGHIRPPQHRPFARCRPVQVYEKIDKIGQGTFGEVFKGRERETGELVALKKVLMKNEQEGFPLTALREIRILKVLHHPNVLSLKEIVHSQATDYNRQKGSIYLVTEYMDHDLGGLLNRGIQFAVPEIMCLTKQLLEGLFYMHVQKILHRDMKVANLLLNKHGNLKIADFGLARGIVANGRYTSTVCTRWYRPPELLLGERHYTEAVDVWGVGCIVAELFTGRPILQGGVAGAKSETENDFDQYLEICKLCGTPRQETWPGFDKLPNVQLFQPKERYQRNLQNRFQKAFRLKSELGVQFVDRLLELDPSKRPTAEKALDHDFFWGSPAPCEPEHIQKFPMECHEWKVPPRHSRIDQPKKRTASHQMAGQQQRPAQPRPRHKPSGSGKQPGHKPHKPQQGSKLVPGRSSHPQPVPVPGPMGHRPAQPHGGSLKRKHPGAPADGSKRPREAGAASAGAAAAASSSSAS